jgi:hypothetical protein
VRKASGAVQMSAEIIHEAYMVKEVKQKKDERKKPALSPKEKKAKKQEKREANKSR